MEDCSVIEYIKNALLQYCAKSLTGKNEAYIKFLTRQNFDDLIVGFIGETFKIEKFSGENLN